jgi:radical SAM protein with 4Fe4S-binding SPASM domain
MQLNQKNNNWKPDTLWWIITGACNLHCKHCYIEAPQNLYGQITTKQAFLVIDNVINNGITNFFITGGEPFLRKDILKIFKRIIDKSGKVIGLDTNGTIINNEIIRFLKGNKVFVNISHDGVDFTNKNRIASIEHNIIKNVKKLTDAGVKVNINSSLNPENSESLILLFNELLDLNIYQWLLFTPFNTGNYLKNYRKLAVDEELEIYEKIYKKWNNLNKPFEIRLGNIFDSTNPETKWNKYICEYFRDTITLFPDGQLVPCCKYIVHEDYQKFPNIFKHKLQDVLKNSLLNDIKKQEMNTIYKQNPECIDCNLLDKCNAGCRIEAYLETKNMEIKDKRNCELMKKSIFIK